LENFSIKMYHTRIVAILRQKEEKGSESVAGP